MAAFTALEGVETMLVIAAPGAEQFGNALAVRRGRLAGDEPAHRRHAVAAPRDRAFDDARQHYRRPPEPSVSDISFDMVSYDRKTALVEIIMPFGKALALMKSIYAIN